jgi:hypothetical protein
MIVDGPNAAAKGAGIADFHSKSYAADPKMQLVAHAFAFHLVSFVTETKRKDVGTREDGIHFDLAPIDAARPAAFDLIKVEPVVPAVDGDIVGHKPPVATAQLPAPETAVRVGNTESVIAEPRG